MTTQGIFKKAGVLSVSSLYGLPPDLAKVSEAAATACAQRKTYAARLGTDLSLDFRCRSTTKQESKNKSR